MISDCSGVSVRSTKASQPVVATCAADSSSSVFRTPTRVPAAAFSLSSLAAASAAARRTGRSRTRRTCWLRRAGPARWRCRGRRGEGDADARVVIGGSGQRTARLLRIALLDQPLGGATQCDGLRRSALAPGTGPAGRRTGKAVVRIFVQRRKYCIRSPQPPRRRSVRPSFGMLTHFPRVPPVRRQRSLNGSRNKPSRRALSQTRSTLEG